ncbi:autotransporter outer membrane beta-barrel domain-containing protein, partial [Shinella curvata]
EDPTDPTDPEDPTDPTDPEDPTDPTDPEDPTDPTDPEDPTDPTDPEDPTDPTDPEDPTDPTDPEDPTDPTDPEDPTDPTDPEDPTDPTDPEDPTDPTDPEDPTDPTDPEDPTDPTDPEDPLYQPGVPVYEAYPQALLGLNTMPTLQQRVGNRFWLVGGIPEVHQQGASNDLSSAFLAVSGIWARIEGAYSDIEPRFATAGTAFDQSIFRAQAGVDGVFYESANGTLMAGLSTHYRHGVTDTDSIHGIGKISSDGYGAGGALTWYGNDGTYLDGQAQATWYESDLRSLTANRFLVRDNDAFGYALSLEGGKRIAIDDGWSITPQAQIVYSHVDFDRFKDVFGSSVSLDKGASLQGRLGLTLDREMTWQDARGLTSRVNAYGIANIYHEFLNGTRVDVAGEKFRVRQDRLWGGIGAGGTYSWNDGRYSLYAEGLLNTSLAHVGDSYSLQGKIGFRAKW